MPRRREVPKREILPDAKFGDRVVTKFMNNLMYDGIPSGYNGVNVGSQPNLAMFDRVEVVRGATGLVTGAGNRPRNRRSGRRGWPLAANGWVSWIVTGPVCQLAVTDRSAVALMSTVAQARTGRHRSARWSWSLLTSMP